MAALSTRPIRLGTEFRDGKLYSFSRRGILVVSQWPNMRAWRKTPKGLLWQHVRPEMSLEKTEEGWSCVWGHREPRQRYGVGGDNDVEVSEDDLHDPKELPGLEAYKEDEGMRAEALAKNERWQYVEERNARLQAEYLSPIPDEILTAVSCFPNRHWHLLNLVSRCPGAFDLVQSTPALALALSSPWVFREIPPSKPLRSARSLLGKHQTDIASWLGFPAARSTVEILRKLPPEECTVLNLLLLRDLLGSRLKTLQDHSFLNGSIIRLMSGEVRRHDKEDCGQNQV